MGKLKEEVNQRREDEMKLEAIGLITVLCLLENVAVLKLG